jgi:hypothetical protein
MGINPHLLEMAKSWIKQANDAEVQGPRGPLSAIGQAAGAVGRAAGAVGRAAKAPASTIGRGIDAAGRLALRHPLKATALPLAAYGGYKGYQELTKPDDKPDDKSDAEVKQADLPSTPMSTSTTTPGLPAAGPPPPTNAAPVAPSAPQSFGGVTASPVQQTDQAQPAITTSQGAKVPDMGQGAQTRAPGLVKQPGK